MSTVREPGGTPASWLGMVALAIMVVLGVLTMFVGSVTEMPPSPSPPDGPAAPTPTVMPSAAPLPDPSPTTPHPVPTAGPSVPAAPPSDGVTETPRAPLPPSLLGSEWERIPTRRRVVALTFDAGANADAVPAILATLKDRSVPATFFLTGSWTRRFPEPASDIVRLYPVGNHSDTHRDFTTLSNAQIRSEVRRTDRAVDAIGGGDPRPLFRFPYGARDARTLAVVNGMGYGSIRWTIDTLGWKGTSGGMTARRVVRRVSAGLTPGAIVLMHVGSNPDDGSMLDAQALGGVIDAIQSRGYRLVTLRAGADP